MFACAQAILSGFFLSAELIVFVCMYRHVCLYSCELALVPMHVHE